ncbi:MAG TPA: FadR/GntR family transcriptional regulator [Rhizomicrobium sp.]|nr:FadR/GntR family transcriptional regulator [Rhizomicrobium sp.]
METTKPAIRIPGKIAAGIGAKILSGRLKPGTILDGEIAASDLHKVSRSAYREAIRILTAKGLVHSRPKIGTRVTELDHWHLLDPDVLAWMFAREPPRALLVSLFELRKLVEPEAAALAAGRRTLKQLNRMGNALEVMASETLQTDAGRNADRIFHTVLLQASANPFLVSLSSSVTAAVTWSTMFKQRTHRLRHNAVTDHIKVYEAVASGDPNAARAAMTELLELAFADATQLRRKSK